MITVIDNALLTYDEWLLARNGSLGASEVGAITYGNNYTCNLQIFYEKITGIKKSIKTLRSYLGKKSENICDSMWPYFENDNNDTIYLNAEKGRFIKKCINTNSTYKNSKFPHITVTPDRIIQPYGIYDGKGQGSLEYKNTQTRILKSFSTGLPTDNVMQLCSQMNVRDDDYGELFFFLDNLYCELHPGKRKDFKTMWQMILDITIPFWGSILKARPLYNQQYEAKRTFNYKLAAELETEIAQLEPPAQNTTGYLNFLTERFKEKMAGGGHRAGTLAELELAKKHKELAKKIDKIEKQQRSIEIEIKNAMKETNVLDFGKNGKITWTPSSNNARPFKNNIIYN